MPPLLPCAIYGHAHQCVLLMNFQMDLWLDRVRHHNYHHLTPGASSEWTWRMYMWTHMQRTLLVLANPCYYLCCCCICWWTWYQNCKAPNGGHMLPSSMEDKIRWACVGSQQDHISDFESVGGRVLCSRMGSNSGEAYSRLSEQCQQGIKHTILAGTDLCCNSSCWGFASYCGRYQSQRALNVGYKVFRIHEQQNRNMHT